VTDYAVGLLHAAAVAVPIVKLAGLVLIAALGTASTKVLFDWARGVK
jgi:hypothetical protein